MKSLAERVSVLEANHDNMNKQLDRLTEQNDEQLAKLDKLSRLVWMGVGGIIVLQFVLSVFVKH